MDFGKIAFIGGGNMTRALVGGMLLADFKPSNILISDPILEVRKKLTKIFPGTLIEEDNLNVINQADCLLLAVKPQILPKVCRSLKDSVQIRKPLIISIAAGLRCDDINTWLGGGLSIIRVMPNQPALLQLGVSGMFANEISSSQEQSIAEYIISTTGPVISVSDENDINAITAISGSGPAYFYKLIDLLIKNAEEMGLDSKSAVTLALETAQGAAAIAKQSEESIDTLISHVRSPGGTTAAALDYLDSKDFDGIFSAAVFAARQRAEELANQTHKDAKG
ncbi:MAG: pyrroline-5-carboxylate reductase [Gammaproteobacteria bacterium]|nr:pyrroline-5-carboxylate reductase [Gammaproteobacteria bacterium]|tara:strand:+ start:5624 stop:6463 length:840 start_codon:yes stop_codon:yes gene_type:complete